MKLLDDFVLSSLGCRPLHLYDIVCLCECVFHCTHLTLESQHHDLLTAYITLLQRQRENMEEGEREGRNRN